jgi:hypothetical protein
MFTFPQILRRSLLAGLTLGILSFTGCQQLSRFTRTENVGDVQSSPTPGFGSLSPQLEPVPQSLPPMPVPPPAPPSDSASLDEAIPEFTAEWNREPEAVSVVAEETEEFAPPVPAETHEASQELTEDRAARFAQEGRVAAKRRGGQPPQLPVIVPATPGLRRVSDDSALLPVPR